jgi:hypothetical protein
MKASILSNGYSCRLGAVMFVVLIHFPMLKIFFIQLALNTKTSTRPFNEHSNNIIIKSVQLFLIRRFWNFQPARTHYCSNSVKFHLMNIHSYNVWFQSAKWFHGRRLKCEKFPDNDGCVVMTIAHLALRDRLAWSYAEMRSYLQLHFNISLEICWP